jgi:hypothetical protein
MARVNETAGVLAERTRRERMFRFAATGPDGVEARVFTVDVLECPPCHGPMRILAQIHPPDTTRAILDSLGLAFRAPPRAPARAEPDPLPFPGHAAAD